MNARIKKYFVSAVLLFVGYFLASQHVIIKNKEFRLLEKPYLTFEYTFYNLTDKRPKDVLKVDMLREAGIGDILVEFEMMTEAERFKWEAYYDNLADEE